MAQPQVASKAIESNKYLCPICPSTFLSSVALQAHAVYSHRTGFYTCSWCALVVKGDLKVRDHARSCKQLASQQEDEFEAFCIIGNYCALCDTSFPPTNVVSHYKHIHMRCAYICDICVKCFDKRENYDLHRADQHPHATILAPKPTFERSKCDKFKLVKEFNKKRCIDCQISFETLTDIVDHFQTEHQLHIYTCEKCEKGYTHHTSLSQHTCQPYTKRMSNDSPSYKRELMREFNKKRCLECDVTFSSLAEIRKHFDKKHFEVLVCEKCAKGFWHKSFLHNHPCEEFTNKLLPMSDRHNMLLDFRQKQCTRCGITFADNNEGLAHFMERHQLKLFYCESCGKSSSAYNWRYHSCWPLSDTKKAGESRQRQRTSLMVEKVEFCTADSTGEIASQERKRGRSIPRDWCVNEPIAQKKFKRNDDDRKHPCGLCSYDIPTFELGLIHYAEDHNIRIFECPAPHCCQLFRRISKWARHFLQSHSDVVLPQQSEFRELLDDIMVRVYHRSIVEKFISSREMGRESIDSKGSIHSDAAGHKISNVRTRKNWIEPPHNPSRAISGAACPIPTIILSDTESDDESYAQLDWGLDVKPVIKTENMM